MENHRMYRENQRLCRGSVPRRLFQQLCPAERPILRAAAMAVLILALVIPAMSQTRTQQRNPAPALATADLIALKQVGAAAEALESSFQRVCQHAFSVGRSNTGEILAFEENKLFIYAMADMSNDTQKDQQWIRRFFLLKPLTFVVEDLMRSPGTERPIRWLLKSTGEPKIEDRRMRVVEDDAEILGHSLLPLGASLKKISRTRTNSQTTEYRIVVTPQHKSSEAHFLQVFHVGAGTGQSASLPPTVKEDNTHLAMTVAARDRIFQLTLPLDATRAGKIKATTGNDKSLVPQRLLPSGIMPHGPEGARLLERWDAPYREDRVPGWDVGRPSSHLVKAVENGTFPPGRAIVLGCGTGSTALYLAEQGFKVTGVDVAPTALALAAEKAVQADLRIDWILADVVALPKLAPFDLIFDRGCYHHICQYNSAGYVETLRRLSQPGTQALILAGSPADGQSVGPPRIKEATIRTDFSALFAFEWLRKIRFDTRDANAQGPSAWSIHLRRKDK
jgi:SAM-dependent methyltransferase